jgi:hypothetical protein
MQHTLRGARILFWDQCNGDEANTASQMGDSGWYGVRPNALSVTRQPHRSNPFQDHGLACVETRAVARTQKIAGFLGIRIAKPGFLFCLHGDYPSNQCPFSIVVFACFIQQNTVG